MLEAEAVQVRLRAKWARHEGGSYSWTSCRAQGTYGARHRDGPERGDRFASSGRGGARWHIPSLRQAAARGAIAR